MAYEIYRLQFQHFTGQYVTVEITDTDSNVGTTTYYDLTPAEDPLTIETIDTDDNPFTPIKGKKVTIKFKSTASYSLRTFKGGEDNRFLVKVAIGPTTVGGTYVWQGYLVQDDMSEPFLPLGSYIVTLTANDNLGVLRDVTFVDFSGGHKRGHYRIIDFVAQALYQTKLPAMNINVTMNLYEETLNGLLESCWGATFLEAKTFEKEIDESEDCYSVLEKILSSFGCRLFQRNLEWWIVRVAEMRNTNLVYWTFDYLGNEGARTSFNPSHTLGVTRDIKLINKSAEIRLIRPHGYEKDVFNYEYPKETPDNIDFSTGSVITAPNLTIASSSGTYDVQYWTLNMPLGGTPATPNSTAYIYREFEWGYEKERYVVFPASTLAGGLSHLYSSRIPVHFLDKIMFSFDTRVSSDIGGSGSHDPATVGQVRLYADDGTYYTLNPADGSWVSTGISFTSTAYTLLWHGTLDEDQSKWRSIGVESQPIPKDGELELIITQNGKWGNSVDSHFMNLQFSYVPFINGSYQKYSAQYHKVSQSGDYKAKKENAISISDSPKKLLKGAVFIDPSGSNNYVLAGRWLDDQDTALGTTSLGKYQAWDKWNQHRREVVILEGELMGLDFSTPGDIPDLVHRYFLDGADMVDDRTFILLSFEQDFKTGRWKALFTDIHYLANLPVFNSTHEFKYLT